jgi:hypothetical protein
MRVGQRIRDRGSKLDCFKQGGPRFL